MVVFALHPAVLRQHPAAERAVRHARHRGGWRTGTTAVFLWACSWRCSSCTASTRRGRSARRRSTRAARRRAASCRRSGCRASSAPIFLLAVILSFRTSRRPMQEGQAVGFPIATTITANLTYAIGGVTVGEIYLVVILDRGLRLHAGDPGRGRPAHVLDGPRSAAAARRRSGATSTRRFHTPANASVAVGVLAAIPFVVTGAGAAIYIADRRDRDDLHLATSCATSASWLPGPWLAAPGGLVQPRQLGHDHQHPGPDLGRADGHQHRPLDGPWPVRGLRERPAEYVVEPVHQHVHQGSAASSRTAPGVADLRE